MIPDLEQASWDTVEAMIFAERDPVLARHRRHALYWLTLLIIFAGLGAFFLIEVLYVFASISVLGLSWSLSNFLWHCGYLAGSNDRRIIMRDQLIALAKRFPSELASAPTRPRPSKLLSRRMPPTI